MEKYGSEQDTECDELQVIPVRLPLVKNCSITLVFSLN